MYNSLEACLSEESSKTSSCVWEPSLLEGGGSDHQAKNNWGWISVWSCFKSGLTPTSKKPIDRKWRVKRRLHPLDLIPKWLYHLTSAVFHKHISRFIITACLSSRASNTPWRYESAYMQLLFFSSLMMMRLLLFFWESVAAHLGE